MNVPTGYSRSPRVHLRGDGLAEAGSETRRGLTVRITDGCIVLMADVTRFRNGRMNFIRLNSQLKGSKTGCLV
ncbi:MULTISPECIES: hypothetical protein [Citrobacter]|uniref:hypothetical protein n=1 Tax=Citrobacter TaxID=544 RepID=UPI00387E1BE4